MPGGSEAKRGMTLPRYNEVVRRVVPRPVVATARDALRRYGTTTASARPLPDYMVAGTKKGGTTSIINWLVDHPHVCRMWPSAQKLKSAHYYDINYGKGEDWYRSHFPTDPLAPRSREEDRDLPARRRGQPLLHVPSGGARAGARDGTVDEGDHAAARPRLARLLQLPRPSRDRQRGSHHLRGSHRRRAGASRDRRRGPVAQRPVLLLLRPRPPQLPGSGPLPRARGELGEALPQRPAPDPARGGHVHRRRRRSGPTSSSSSDFPRSGPSRWTRSTSDRRATR